MLKKVNLAESFKRFDGFWQPKIVGEINDMQVKLVKFQGEFTWHHHDAEDELFLVTDGSMTMRLRDGDLEVNAGEFVIVPQGVEHCPVAHGECQVVLIEPATTLNTGNVENERTQRVLERLA